MDTAPDHNAKTQSAISIARLYRLALIALEVIAVAWVIFYYGFEPVIPVYQGY